MVNDWRDTGESPWIIHEREILDQWVADWAAEGQRARRDMAIIAGSVVLGIFLILGALKLATVLGWL